METVSEIQKKFLKSKLKELELGVRFRNSLPKKWEDYSVEEFLEEFDPADSNNKKLIDCGKKELDLFRLYLEANATDWNKYKIRRLFKFHYFRRGIFLKTNKLNSEEFNFVYQNLHRKRTEVEIIQQLKLF